MKLSACVDMIYWGKDFFKSSKELIDSGIDAIEFWKWSDKDIDRIKNEICNNGVKIAGFCVDSSDSTVSESCLVNILSKGMKDKFVLAISESIDVAKKLNADFLIATVGDNVEGLSYDEQVKNIKDCLYAVKDIIEENKITLLLEPINCSERTNYLMPEADDVMKIIKDVNSGYIKLLYDVYHQNITGDFSLEYIIENINHIGHIHIADVPGRNEPGSGIINFKNILTTLNDLNYNGYAGLEYVPANATVADTVKDIKEIIK